MLAVSIKDKLKGSSSLFLLSISFKKIVTITTLNSMYFSHFTDLLVKCCGTFADSLIIIPNRPKVILEITVFSEST